MKAKDLFAIIGLVIAILAILGAAAYAVHRFFGLPFSLPEKKKKLIETELEPDGI